MYVLRAGPSQTESPNAVLDAEVAAARAALARHAREPIAPRVGLTTMQARGARRELDKMREVIVGLRNLGITERYFVGPKTGEAWTHPAVDGLPRHDLQLLLDVEKVVTGALSFFEAQEALVNVPHGYSNWHTSDLTFGDGFRPRELEARLTLALAPHGVRLDQLGNVMYRLFSRLQDLGFFVRQHGDPQLLDVQRGLDVLFDRTTAHWDAVRCYVPVAEVEPFQTPEGKPAEVVAWLAADSAFDASGGVVHRGLTRRVGITVQTPPDWSLWVNPRRVSERPTVAVENLAAEFKCSPV